MAEERHLPTGPLTQPLGHPYVHLTLRWEPPPRKPLPGDLVVDQETLMPYPAAHSLLTFSGPAFNDQEEWSTGVRLRRTAPPSLLELEDCSEAFVVLCSTQNLGASANVLLQSTKWAPQTTEGRYGLGNSVEYLNSPPLAFGNVNAPPQIAFVISLRTAKPRGRGSNGRMYLPCMPLLENDGSGQISVAHRDTAAQAGAVFISMINSILATECVVGSTVGAGLLETITGVRAGRALDTQRRRRAGIPENYSGTVPATF